jgi:hypothetical protein
MVQGWNSDAFERQVPARDTATIIPPPEIWRERTGIARSKGPEPLGA